MTGSDASPAAEFERWKALNARTLSQSQVFELYPRQHPINGPALVDQPPAAQIQSPLDAATEAALAIKFEVASTARAALNAGNISVTQHVIASDLARNSASVANEVWDEIQGELGGFFFGQVQGLRRSEFIIEGLIPVEGLGFLYGPPGSNKSTLAADIAVHLAANALEWNGKVIKPSPVIFWAMENPRGAFQSVQGLAKKYGLQVGDRAIFVPERPMDLKTAAGFTVLVKAIGRMAQMNGNWPRLIIIDGLSDALGGADDSDQKEVKQLLFLAEQLALKLGVFFLFIHHEAKGTGTLRGSGTLKAKAYSVLRVEMEGELPARQVVVEKLRGAANGEKFKMTRGVFEWEDAREGQLSCAAVEFEFTPPDFRDRTPEQRYKSRLQGLSGKQKAICTVVYDTLSARQGIGIASPTDRDGQQYKAMTFDEAFTLYREFCERNQIGAALTGTHGAQRSDLRKVIKNLNQKKGQIITLAEDGDRDLVYIEVFDLLAHDYSQTS
jgi:AAA domain